MRKTMFTLFPTCLLTIAITLALTHTAPAQAIFEIPAMTVNHSHIDMDNVGPAGPTTVAAINAAGTPTPASIQNIVLPPTTAAAGVYDTNPTRGRALGLDSSGTGLALIDPQGGFAAFNAQIYLSLPSTEIGFSIADWNGPMLLDFYLGTTPVGPQFTTTNYSASALVKYFQVQGGTFDRVDIQASTATGNWVIPDLYIENTDFLLADFSASPLAGPSPLTVSFQNLSATTDPGGITSYAWDLDGDGLTDSTVQNPSFTYAGACTQYTVSLTVTDAVHSPATETKTNYIYSDGMVPDFTASPVNGCPPLIVQFTDNTAGVVASWAWDLDGDGIVDSNQQNPSFTYTALGAYDVTLTTTNPCTSTSVTKTRIVELPYKLTTLFSSNNYGSVGGGVYFDIQVTNPVSIVGFEINTTATAGSPVGLAAWTAPVTSAGVETTPSAWTMVGQDNGAAVSAGQDSPTTVYLASPFLLPPGSYGLALQAIGMAHAYTNGTGTNQNFSDANIALSLGTATNVFHTAPLFTPRVWNGSILYCQGCAGAAVVAGQGCTDSSGTPLAMSTSGCPDLGDRFTINVATGASVTNPVFLVGGASNQLWLGLQLPLDLTLFGAQGCSVYSSHELIVGPFPNPGGGSSASFQIPANPIFVGATSYWQGYMFQPGVNPLSLVTSDYLSATIGQ